ncbi:MAG TPA: RNA-guided endonuclease TnpB family protein [Ktedonobacteraceae bacterium]|nr:RNA-guided endonuclease TnpB family protein [Ktedonobacteraceae bacterium]
MKQKKAYKYRFYPSDKQKRILAQTFGCCRYVYNWALRERTDAYYQHGERLYYEGTAQRLVTLKKQEETIWLNEVSSVPLQQALRHLDKAFRNFFEGCADYPTFKKKRNQQSATYASNAFTWDGHTLTLAKMDAPLSIVWHRPLPDGLLPSTVTITKDEANRYFVSILVEEDIKPLEVTPKMVGLDLGLKSMVITSDGHTYGNPQFFAKDEKKLAKAQRRHAKKKKGSKNRAKARLKVARIHKKIADRRRNYQHQLSTHTIRENQVVCVESLSVKNMVKNRCLAKAISDVGWAEFVRQLEYKAAWYGRTLVKIDKWYPSSKRCFDCGHILDSLTLDVRSWTCPQCGVVHDRDINAAKNILAAGLAVAACGEAVRPGAVKTKPGKPPRSRKAS